MDNIKAIYIHIPFCKKICSYCDFCKMYYQKELVLLYLDALEKEIKSNYSSSKIETIYIGGGSPSSLDFLALNKLLKMLEVIDKSNLQEFSFEMNVADITENKLKILKKYGVNRISIGIETINDKFFPLIERYNNKDDVYKKINLVKKYFNNINVDFMYGFPNETISDLKKDLAFFKKLEVNHISIYSLILEEHTKLYINKVKAINEDLEAKMYYYIIDYLKSLGYQHYEISNFAKDNWVSKHNLTYWNNEKYYGFGLGAGGYIDNIRYTNTRSINNYLKGNYRLEEEKITKEINMENEMILGLRKREGISKKRFKEKFKEEVEDVFPIKELVQKDLLIDKDDYIYINPSKLYVSNNILINFIKNS